MAIFIRLLCCFLALALLPRWAIAVAKSPSAAQLHVGRQVYESACLACHGPVGAGLSQERTGFTPPDSFPDFSDCSQSAPEYTRDWRATITYGGPARGFSEIMPAFGEALTVDQITAVIAYLRSLCSDRSWPPGELNVPRALVTEKAFPEDEVVWTTSIDSRGTPNVTHDLINEWQFSSRDQLEVDVPVDFMRAEGGPVRSGLGDIAIGVKHVLLFDLDPTMQRGSILSVQAEILAPSGSKAKGLGTGQVQAGGFVAYDVLLPDRGFLQVQAGGDIPRHTAMAAPSVYSRLAAGRSFAQPGLGRLWTPMLEFVASRDLDAGSRTDFDLIPECQVTLNQRQHVMANMGYRIALNDKATRSNQLVIYVLWDWLDGKLTEGW